MTSILKVSQSTKTDSHNNQTPSLPWWTWVAPFFIANLGTWLSIWFKVSPGASLWYLPTAFGIIMAYWWGPRALLGIYLNAVVCTPLWDLPWQWSFLYALSETIEVGLSWLLFIKLMRGKHWLPNLENVGLFLLFGSLAPALFAKTYWVTQLYLLHNLAQGAVQDTWQILFSSDLATQFVFVVPILILFTKLMNEKGWTVTKNNISALPLLSKSRSSLLDITVIAVIFISVPILMIPFSNNELWFIFGGLMIFIAVRYGVNMAVVGSSWIGILAFLFPVILTGQVGFSPTTYYKVLNNNFGVLFLCAVTLITGRAISDLLVEVDKHKQVEENLHRTETQYRTLIEQIPPIIYISDPDQRIGATYISPRIEALGFSQEEWISDPKLWFEQIHPEDQERVLAKVEQNINNPEPFSTEYRLLSRNGQVRWFLDEFMNIVDLNGKLLYRQGFMLDITARKTAEESLTSREHYLALLNDMTRTILLSHDYDSTLHTLAFDLKKIFNADDCYITRWNEENQISIPVTMTAKLDFPLTEVAIQEELSLTASILQTGQVLAVDDVFHSPHISLDIANRYHVHSMIGIPMVIGNHKLGVATIAFNTPHHITTEEVERAEQAGNQVALALWAFQQAVEIQQSLKESHTLAKISRALSEMEHVGTSEVLQLIVDSARELMPHAEKSVIHLLETGEGDEVLVARAVSGFGEQEKEYKRVKMRLGEGVAGQVIREGITINIGNIEANSQFIVSDSLPTFRSLLVAPVQSSGRQIGTISIQSVAVNAFSEKDSELLNALGVQAAIALENTRLFETIQQQLKEMDALYKTSQGLASSLNTDNLIKDFVNLLHQNFDYYHVQIYLKDLENDDLVLKSGSGEIGAQLSKQNHRMPRGTGIVGHVVGTATPFITNDVNKVAFFVRHALLPDTQSELAVPIKVDEKVVGVLDIQHTAVRQLTEDDLQLMIAVADQLSVALQRANLYSNLETVLKQEQTMRSQLIQSERLALVGRLLASVSHELNNPLQAIQNALFLLRDETNLSNQAKQDLNVILSEAERMAALIERLRGAYRPVRVRDFKPVNLNELIEDVYMLITTHMRHKEITFEFIPDDDLPPISGMPDQIRQVALNLFLNAIEIMKPGGRLTVETHGLPLQNEILFTVKDTGPGIDPEILPRIFDPFITSKHTGTGLGLTITHDIIQQHHGRIIAENDPKGGAIFKVWLPITDEEG